MRSEYKLRYLPLFYEDLLERVLYIKERLDNPKAASDLVDVVEKAIIKRLPDCECFEPYHSNKTRENPYYRIYVKNYIIFYVVIDQDGEKIMEVRRFVYSKQDRDMIL